MAGPHRLPTACSEHRRRRATGRRAPLRRGPNRATPACPAPPRPRVRQAPPKARSPKARAPKTRLPKAHRQRRSRRPARRDRPAGPPMRPLPETPIRAVRPPAGVAAPPRLRQGIRRGSASPEPAGRRPDNRSVRVSPDPGLRSRRRAHFRWTICRRRFARPWRERRWRAAPARRSRPAGPCRLPAEPRRRVANRPRLPRSGRCCRA